MGSRRNESLMRRVRENQSRTGILVDQTVNKSLRNLGQTTSVKYVKSSTDEVQEDPIRLGLVRL